MTARPFHCRYEELPRVLPVFPLAGALLLPRGKLPLNIFEPRYLAMAQDALAQGRFIGMIQPTGAPAVQGGEPPLYETGCAGRITAFAETDDGRIMMTLTGACRFHVSQEGAPISGYRRILPDFSHFRGDLDDPPENVAVDRPRLLSALRPFVALHSLDVNWKAVEAANDVALLTSLPMLCPFEAREKQALLECPDIASRGQTLIALMEMAVAENGRGQPLVKQ